MECSCEQLADCMEENIINNQGSDFLTLCLLGFIFINNIYSKLYFRK